MASLVIGLKNVWGWCAGGLDGVCRHRELEHQNKIPLTYEQRTLSGRLELSAKPPAVYGVP